MKTLIVQTNNGWSLRIKQNGMVLFERTFKRLIDAYDCANMLALHVDNEAALPLRQYAYQSESKQPIILEEK